MSWFTDEGQLYKNSSKKEDDETMSRDTQRKKQLMRTQEMQQVTKKYSKRKELKTQTENQIH